MIPGAFPGVAIGQVVDVNDEEGQGRVKVRYPWLDDELISPWAPIVAPFAGADRGVYFMPEVDDEVMIGFIQGDFNRPCVLGAMWNGVSTAPSDPRPDPRQRMIRSKNGHTIRFVDSTPTNGDMGALIIEDGHGNRITMSNGLVAISSKGVLMLQGKTIVLQSMGVNRVVTPIPEKI